MSDFRLKNKLFLKPLPFPDKRKKPCTPLGYWTLSYLVGEDEIIRNLVLRCSRYMLVLTFYAPEIHGLKTCHRHVFFTAFRIRPTLYFGHSKTSSYLHNCRFSLGGRGRIRTIEVVDNRFTGNSPVQNISVYAIHYQILKP